MIRHYAVCTLFFVALCSAQAPPRSGSQTWTGALFDTLKTTCSSETQGASPAGTCPVSMATKSFGIRLPDGKLYPFDEGGNAKTVTALKKSRKAGKEVFAYWQTGKTAKPIQAKVTGSVTSNTLNLESIQID
jgi:hypothetical protein